MTTRLRRPAYPAGLSAWSLIVLFYIFGSGNILADEPRFVGSQSCATSTCHGGVIGSGPAWHYSMSTWIARDPHAGAGLLLRDDDSHAIVTRLDPTAATSREAFDNVLRTRCISCHATSTADQCAETGLLSDAALAGGVSCESCHGAAESWLKRHVRKDWSGQRRFERDTGMLDTESILGRAENCVRCHIGSRSADGLVRDMNHDLIAAGHPALRFDLLLFNENLPKHWDVQSETAKEFNRSAVRVRKVGRAMNLSAAASLSSERASDHLEDASVPWPELADYDCFACHQALSMREYRLPPGDGSKSSLRISAGLPIWNAWHTINQLKLTNATLDVLSPRRSDPVRIAGQCKQLASGYRNVAQVRMEEDLEPAEVIQVPLRQLKAGPPRDWHQAAIQYLELDAALRDLASDSATAEDAGNYAESLREAERLLRFDRDQPQGERAEFLSPIRFDPDAFRASVLKAFNLQPNVQAATTSRSNTPTFSRSGTNQP